MESNLLAKFLKIAVVCLALVLSLGTPLHAQSTSSFQGTVLDPQGSPVADAKIVVTNLGTGIESTSASDTTGAFCLQAYPPENTR